MERPRVPGASAGLFMASSAPVAACGDRSARLARIFSDLTLLNFISPNDMPCGRKRKRHKIATHKRKKRLRKNRHKKKVR